MAVLVIAFVVIGTGSDDDSGDGTVGPVGTAAQQQPSDGGTTEAEPADTAEPTATPEPAPVVRVEGGEPVGGVQEIKVDKGERVRFSVRPDAEDEVHVHGYDRYADVGPGKPGASPSPPTPTASTRSSCTARPRRSPSCASIRRF